MSNLKDRIQKLKKRDIKKVTETLQSTSQESEQTDSFFDFIIGGALIVVAFVFGRK